MDRLCHARYPLAVASESERIRPGRWLVLIPLGLAVASFSVGLRGGFVEDDFRTIVDNPVVTGKTPLHALFTRNCSGDPLDTPPASYRPLFMATLRLDHALFGRSPLGYHASSLLYYLALVLVAWRLALIWLEERAALLATSLFAVLPIHAENVACLLGRAETLSLLGCLCAMLFLRGPLLGRPATSRGIVGAAGMFSLALLSKENAILFPLCVLAILACAPSPGRDDSTSRLGALVWRHRPALVLLALAVAYLAVRTQVAPLFQNFRAPDDVLIDAHLWQRVVFALELVARYAWLLVTPLESCTGRKYAEVSLPERALSGEALLGAGLLALIAWAAVRSHRQRRPPFGLCAVLCWLVYSSLLSSPPEAMADRFMLAPSFFLCLGVGGLVRSRWLRGWLSWVPVGLLLGILGAMSAVSSTHWQDNLTLFRQAVRSCPNSVHNQLRMGLLLARAGDHHEAVWRCALASEGRRHFPRAWRHPALDAEQTMSAAERVRRMHQLLRVSGPEVAWRRALAAFFVGQGLPEEARVTLLTAPGAPDP
jgi:hypothetical protein